MAGCEERQCHRDRPLTTRSSGPPCAVAGAPGAPLVIVRSRRALARGRSTGALGDQAPPLNSLQRKPMTNTMRAYVVKEPGGSERLELREIPRPSLRDGWALIRIRAFGLNWSEWFTRRGESPSVKFPRVLGIECVGEVVAAPGCNLSVGQRVAAMMGGMGRQFDGSYAEYVLAPQQNVFPLQTHLD